MCGPARREWWAEPVPVVSVFGMLVVSVAAGPSTPTSARGRAVFSCVLFVFTGVRLRCGMRIIVTVSVLRRLSAGLGVEHDKALVQVALNGRATTKSGGLLRLRCVCVAPHFAAGLLSYL
ncbi:uncharacterized protein TEOVI_000790100 [Trypanosoma equiperdum]|uniref:Uncharacterized protein n=2 Tax=Trypanozoon TaxID=39700 RepID=Q38E93_TRYB2|nr:hypothetical protein, unlikely [Trypanosoma brucei brucei TREU927]EAN76877.1 hypothetical protein, unlikely [Trypanosoma brucei brucei TREU927]SCU64402.1 hypothetical protein, conserved [Trypanosoma equiperdum]